MHQCFDSCPCLFWVCVFWQALRLIFKERGEAGEGGSRKYWVRYEAAIFDCGWCEGFELWEWEWLGGDREIRYDWWKVARAMLLFVHLCVCRCAWWCSVLVISTAVSQHSINSDDLIVYITSIHSLFSSSISSLSLPLTHSCLSCPSFFFYYLFIDPRCHCG